jgi:DNA adenine methylase
VSEEPLKAPFPWFGGKSTVAQVVWDRLGNVSNYIEPFFGSGAVLLARPHPPRIETINDKDCYVANFWRAMKNDPAAVAEFADWPVNEADLHARHKWLVLSETAGNFRDRMMSDPDYFDAKVAGWWVWGLCQWIGGGWCTAGHRGVRVRSRPQVTDSANGVHKMKLQMRECGAELNGKGIHVKRPQLSGHAQRGVHRRVKQQLPDLSGDSGASGRGVHRKRPSLTDGNGGGGHKGVIPSGNGTCAERREWLIEWFHALQDRLRNVRVCCGEWKRICGSRSSTVRIGVTGVFLDPPYAVSAGRDDEIYTHDQVGVAAKAGKWALEHGRDPRMRIALCGFEGEHDQLAREGWSVVAWKSQGGYGNRRAGNKNRDRERIWFSPHCLTLDQGELFDLADTLPARIPGSEQRE